jgi:transcriptional regulator with GAF, ATPase, and Fis domain
MSEEGLTQTFVELADTLVAGFDLIEFLQMLTERCVQLCQVDAAGVLLTDPQGTLALVAASSEQAQLVELFQLQTQTGPCLAAYRSRAPVICADLGAPAQRWPAFAAAARAGGFAAVSAVPMRLREQVIGALNMFRARPGRLEASRLALAQALADVATIGIVHERILGQRELVIEQLQVALDSRVVIEQAKGMLAERGQLSPQEAFVRLRGWARDHNRPLTQVAHAVITGTVQMAELLPGSAPGQP